MKMPIDLINNIGEEIEDEFVSENHAIMMYNPMLEYNEKVINK